MAALAAAAAAWKPGDRRQRLLGRCQHIGGEATTETRGCISPPGTNLPKNQKNRLKKTRAKKWQKLRPGWARCLAKNGFELASCQPREYPEAAVTPVPFHQGLETPRPQLDAAKSDSFSIASHSFAGLRPTTPSRAAIMLMSIDSIMSINRFSGATASGGEFADISR